MSVVRGKDAALAAAERLAQALLLLNATDEAETGHPLKTPRGVARLSLSGRGTTWGHVESALYDVVATLALPVADMPFVELTGHTPGSVALRVIDVFYDCNESVAHCLRHVLKDVQEDVRTAVAERF